MSRRSMTLALALTLACLLPSESQAQCNVSSATWVTSPGKIACGESATFTFKMQGTCSVVRQLYYTVYDKDDFGDNDLVAETHEVNLGSTFDKNISFDLTCYDDCSELNGPADDSDENPTQFSTAENQIAISATAGRRAHRGHEQRSECRADRRAKGRELASDPCSGGACRVRRG